MKHTLQEWANLAGIIGNFAIIVSLVFVGLQISDTTREMRASTAYNATVALQTWYNEVGTNQQASEVFRKGMNDPASLSKDEAMQFIMCIHSVMLAYQNVYFAGVEGTLDAAMYKAMTSTLEAAVSAPGFEWYWQQRAGYMTDEFGGFVAQIMTTQPKGGAEIYR
jgi:hypothetical protein